MAEYKLGSRITLGLEDVADTINRSGTFFTPCLYCHPMTVLIAVRPANRLRCARCNCHQAHTGGHRSVPLFMSGEEHSRVKSKRDIPWRWQCVLQLCSSSVWAGALEITYCPPSGTRVKEQPTSWEPRSFLLPNHLQCPY